ncbi:MAG: hypothetical protein HY360_23750 [Verrucomicrobia bacterium]|nr:hypothetical protein [Verrucomicrobiota bacterium]
MNETSGNPSETPVQRRLNFFERYLSLWVLVCMGVGVAFGKWQTGITDALSKLEFGAGSQVNVPIGILLWLMIYPMMLKVDFSAIGGVTRKSKGLLATLFINWLVKPFSMALLGWIFLQHVFAAWIPADAARDFTAGLIILAAAPCTAMVFVWSYLTDGDPAYTLVQVAVNDLIMLVAFAPLVMFLCGVAQVVVPAKVLITSVIVFIVINRSRAWYERGSL